jgi:sec-independent protein translocase protein TatA
VGIVEMLQLAPAFAGDNMQISVWNILIIAALVFLLFGSQKFPSMMKNLADGIKVFKKEIGDKNASATGTVSKKKKAPAKKKK